MVGKWKLRKISTFLGHSAKTWPSWTWNSGSGSPRPVLSPLRCCLDVEALPAGEQPKL